MRYFYHRHVVLLLISSLGTSRSVDTKCETGSITKETWNEMKIDSYLSEGTMWDNSTLEVYARSVKASNFRCGIGQQCSIGQICSPVTAPDWHVLYAVQEWNLRMNLLYKVSAFAIDIVKETTSSLLSDLTKPDTAPRAVMGAAVLAGFLASLTGLASFLVAAISVDMFAVQVFATTALLSTGALVALPDIAPTVSTRPEHNEFISLATISYRISNWGLEYHRRLDYSVKEALKSPMNATGGLIDILKGGSFFDPRQTMSAQKILDGYRGVLGARVVVAVLRAKNAFITRGDDLCTGKGPNGADVGSNRLSWCDKSGVMMRIVTANGDKVEKDIYAGEIIAAKYGFSTELITTSSWNCQKKYGIGHDPYKNRPLPNDVRDECVINLAVCDCTRTDIQKVREEKGLAVACRGIGLLPI